MNIFNVHMRIFNLKYSNHAAYCHLNKTNWNIF
jgi:hypothetical protein